jgi:16S rRNA (guanine966-N2)-methyltransferase
VVAAIEAQREKFWGMAERVQIVRSDAIRFVASVSFALTTYLFLDPPFHHAGWIERLAASVAAIVAADGVIYVEAERLVEHCGDWSTVRSGRAGQVFYQLMKRGEADGTE